MAVKPLKILQASAGSGKTFSLAVHYLTLLFSGDNKYREILAVTFTNKATAEMKERILEVLEALAKGDESQKTADYRIKILEAHPQLNAEKLKLKADQIYRKILHDYSRFAVSTIDGFVQKVIRGFAFELGFNSGYSLELNIDKVKQELTQKLDKLLNEKDNLLEWVVALALSKIENNKNWSHQKELLGLVGEIFNDKFQAFEGAVNSFGADNADEVFKKYIDFSKDLIKSFEEKLVAQAQKCQQIIDDSGLTPDDFKGKSRSPLLKFNNIINKDFAAIEKLDKLLDAEEEWMGKGKPNILYAAINPLLHQLFDSYQQGIGDYVLAKAFVKNAYYLRLMQEIAILMKQYREESESLLISDAQKMLDGIAGEKEGTNPSFIWEKMGAKYQHFLFDEFQDTSANQWQSFVELVRNSISSYNGKYQDHLIVGDTKQAIYRWRDGDYKLLHSGAKQSLGAYNVEESVLTENYRSTAEIVSFNNELYPNLAQKLQGKINSQIPPENEHISQLWNKEGNNYNSIITDIYSAVAQKTHSKTLPGGVIKIKKITFEKSEDTDAPQNKTAQMLAEALIEIKVLLDEKGYQPKEIGILVRTNAEATSVVEALMNAGLDVISGEALAIANHSAIKLIINVLKLLVVTPENSALYKANAMALYAKVKNETIDSNRYFDLKNTNIEQLDGPLPPVFCQNYRTWIKLPLPELVEKIVMSFGLATQNENNINPNIPYLLAFRDICASATKQGEKGIYAFLKWWDTDGHKKNLPSPETTNAIQVTTIAKSKGLAYRAVFIPFCNWSLNGKPGAIFWVPTENTPYADLHNVPLNYTSSLGSSSVGKYYLEEMLFNHMDALNNLYVATTRAKDYIYMGVVGKKKPSLTNVGDAILELYADDFEYSDEIQIGTYSPIGDKIKTLNAITLNAYPTSTLLDGTYEAKDEEQLPLKYIDNLVKSGERGNILHQILSEIGTADEVPAAIENLALQGVIKQEDKAAYQAQLMDVLSHTELSALLKQPGKQVNEKSIITADGKVKRIDKLILNGDKAIIIDYKFTNEESQSHISQLNEYKNLIKQMGYNDVKSYLFYNKTKTLKEV